MTFTECGVVDFMTPSLIASAFRTRCTSSCPSTSTGAYLRSTYLRLATHECRLQFGLHYVGHPQIENFQLKHRISEIDLGSERKAILLPISLSGLSPHADGRHSRWRRTRRVGVELLMVLDLTRSYCYFSRHPRSTWNLSLYRLTVRVLRCTL